MPSIEELYPDAKVGDVGVVVEGGWAHVIGTEVSLAISPVTGMLSVALGSRNWSHAYKKYFKFTSSQPKKKGYAKWISEKETVNV